MTAENRSSSGEPAGWRVLMLAAAAGVALQLAATAYSVATSAPEFRLAGALASGGFLGLRALIAYGVWEKARWSLWAGSAVALLTILVALAAQVLSARVETGSGVVEASGGITAALAWSLALVNAVFLYGVALLWLRRRS